MRKTLPIYEQLSEEDKMMWLTSAQVASFDALKFTFEENLNALDYSDKVRKRHMVVHTDRYENWVKKGSEGKFIWEKYEVRIFYNREDVKEFADNELEVTPFEDMHVVQWPMERLDDLRSHLNDRRNIMSSEKMVTTEFYGDKRMAIRHSSRENQYRLHYGAFLMHGYITDTFKEMYDLTDGVFEMLIYIYTYKFFTYRDFTGFWMGRSSFSLGDGTRSQYSKRKLVMWLLENGYSYEVHKKHTSMHKTKYRRQIVYGTTEKTDRMMKIYFDWIMFREKMPFEGRSYNTSRITRLDLKVTKDKPDGTRGNNKHSYSFYEYVYDYINYKAEVELFDGSMDEFMKKAESREFYYNPIVMRISYERYISSLGKNENQSYLKHLLENRRWGINT